MRYAAVAAALLLSGCVTTATAETPAERQRRLTCEAQVDAAMMRPSDDYSTECDRPGRCISRRMTVMESLMASRQGRMRYPAIRSRQVDACLSRG